MHIFLLITVMSCSLQIKKTSVNQLVCTLNNPFRINQPNFSECHALFLQNVEGHSRRMQQNVPWLVYSWDLQIVSYYWILDTFPCSVAFMQYALLTWSCCQKQNNSRWLSSVHHKSQCIMTNKSCSLVRSDWEIFHATFIKEAFKWHQTLHFILVGKICRWRCTFVNKTYGLNTCDPNCNLYILLFCILIA